MSDQDEKVTLGEVWRSVTRIEDSIKALRDDFSEQYVTQNEFRPVARLVYGFSACVLLAFIGAMVKLVIQ